MNKDKVRKISDKYIHNKKKNLNLSRYKINQEIRY